MSNIPYRLLGEQYVDFFIPDARIPIVIRVMGGYWHKNKYEEQLKTAKIKKYFNFNVRIIDVDSKELGSVAEAMDFVRREVMS